MWNNKLKAVTFSYDDGVMQDKRLVEIFNKYNLKCTFNINSGMMSNLFVWNCRGLDVVRMDIEECKKTFTGHEIACHGMTHPDFTKLDENQLERQILGDKIMLERIFETPVTGMAYPGGQYDKRVEDVLKSCGIKYSRTVEQTENFDICENFLELNATCHHNNPNIFNLIDEFVNLKTDKPQLLYIWGHSYEFDLNNNWERIEEISKRLSGKEDIFYGTNHRVLSPFYK